MKMKRLFGSLMLSGALVLSACGADEDATSEETDTNGEETQETVEVTIWHAMNGPHQEALTKLTDEFNESQDKYLVIEENQGDYSTLNQSIIAGGASGTLPTMGQLTPGNSPTLAEDGLLVSIDDVLTGEDGFTQEQLDDIYEGFLSSSVYNGSTYAIPFSKSARVMYYNQDLLDEYDVDVPETWDQVIELGKLMTENNDDAVAMGFENGIEMEYETMARQNGSDFITKDLEVDIAGAESVEALEMFMDMLDNGYARTAGEDGYFSGPFGRGESALYIGSSAGLPHVAPVAEENGINWSTAELPTIKGNKLTLFAGNDIGVFTSASEEEKQAAIAYLSFLLEPENSAEWAMSTGYLPISQSALADDSYQAFLEENPAAVAASKELEYGISSPIFVGYAEYRNVLLDTLEDVVVNGRDVQDALDHIETETKSIIENQN